jgi:hypothetical protein
MERMQEKSTYGYVQELVYQKFSNTRVVKRILDVRNAIEFLLTECWYNGEFE